MFPLLLFLSLLIPFLPVDCFYCTGGLDSLENATMAAEHWLAQQQGEKQEKKPQIPTKHPCFLPPFPPAVGCVRSRCPMPFPPPDKASRASMLLPSSNSSALLRHSHWFCFWPTQAVLFLGSWGNVCPPRTGGAEDAQCPWPPLSPSPVTRSWWERVMAHTDSFIPRNASHKV